MKKLTRLLFLLSSLILISCGNDDDANCSTVICVSPAMNFEFVNAQTEENLLENESLVPENVEIIVSGINAVSFRYNENSHDFSLFIENWPSDSYDISIVVNSASVLEMELDAERNRGECCSSVELSNIVVTEGEYSLIEDHYYQIRLD